MGLLLAGLNKIDHFILNNLQKTLFLCLSLIDNAMKPDFSPALGEKSHAS